MSCVWKDCDNQRTDMTIRNIWGERRFDLCDTHIAMTLRAIETHKAQVEERIDAERPIRKGDIVTGWIYYAYIDDTIKIGFTTNLLKRMLQYPPTARLLAVEPGTKKLERVRHSLFHVHLAHGREWFVPNAELDAWISTVIEKHGPPPFETAPYNRPGDTPPIVAGKRHYTPRR